MSMSSRRGASSLIALIAALLACLACSTPALAAGDHDHGGHGGSKPLPADADRCDLGFNTKAYNDVIRNGTADDKRYNGQRFKSLFMSPLS